MQLYRLELRSFEVTNFILCVHTSPLTDFYDVNLLLRSLS